MKEQYKVLVTRQQQLLKRFEQLENESSCDATEILDLSTELLEISSECAAILSQILKAVKEGATDV